ncbi:hypothetical protein BDZ89DRAFT_1108794 [Hymenopellis radicata]|nr:hypothetical protein BDZ89DRAFT_1108794 [Hymenopellis radicata]
MSASGNRRPPKKSKVQACATCRKVKARCEVLEANSVGIRKCHRCTAVKITCSFESEPIPPPPPPPPAPSSQPLLEQSSLDLSSSLAIPPDTFPERLSLGVNVAAHPRVNLPVYFTVGTPSAPSSNDVSFNFRPLWAFVGELVDWSTPILAIQELAKVPEVSSSSFVVHDKLLHHILSQSEVDNLLSIFTVHYTPWLNFSLVRTGSDHVFLDLVCCTIASRYLDASTRFLIAPRLQNLIKDKIAEMVFNPSDFQSLETVQALIILALWSPICGFGAQGDGKMLIVNQARIWTVLTNTESMICVGSGRQTISKRSPPDLDLFPILSPDTIEEGRDLRIRLSSELFNATERGLQAKLSCREQIEEWFNYVSTSLEELDGLVRLIKPLPIVCTDEKFHFHVLHCIALCCRQCILYNAVLSARNLVKDKYPVVHGPTSLWAWFEEIRPHGLNVIPQWGKESTRNAEAVLTFFLQCDRTSLATSPDILFAMIAFCGGLLSR